MPKEVASFELNGAKEIDDMLSNLPLAIQATILKSVHREAAKITQKEMIRNAPPGGNIPENIRIKNDKENKTGVTVGPTSKAFHARFLEYGTESRETKKGAFRGQVGNPKPFIKPAIDKTIGPVRQFITDNYGELVNKYLERQIKKVNRAANKK